jgi:predicted ATP-grasp superfamily ATP-dependent carboligase/SAM-dependent methyltransferase
MAQDRLPVLVLAPPQYVAGPVGAMRTLGRLGVPVYALAHQQRSAANASRFCAGTVTAGENGRPAGAESRILTDLSRAAYQIGGRPILLPVSDEWALFVASHAGALSRDFSLAAPPLRLVRDLASKQGLHQLANRHGLPTPRIVIPRSLEEAGALAGTLQFPVMLKPVVSRPAGQTKQVVVDAESLVTHYRQMDDPGNILCQEYIPGNDEDVWIFNGYFDENSRCLAAFTGRKLRQHPAHMGIASLGVLTSNPPLIDATIQFLAVLGYRGVVDIGYRWDRRDRQYKVLDVNPRLGGAFRMFVDVNGMDVVRALYLDLTGAPVQCVAAREGRRWVVEVADLMAFKEYRRLDGLRFRDWIRSFRGVEEGATLSLSDPLPFLIDMLNFARRTIRARWKRRLGKLKSAADRQLGRLRSLAAVPRLAVQLDLVGAGVAGGRPVLPSTGGATPVSADGPAALTDLPHAKREASASNFQAEALDWTEMYERSDVLGAVFERRRQVTLELADQLGLAGDSPVLDAGCGAGLTAVALAQRGYRVVAIDPSPAMLELTRRHGQDADVLARISTSVGDIGHLGYGDGTFSLVMAVGVIPWLDSPGQALKEVRRVLCPGGYAILTVDNRARLNHLLDPQFSPMLEPARRLVLSLRRRLRGGREESRFHPRLIWPRRFDSALEAACLQKIAGRTVGFGPFAFWGVWLPRGEVAIRLDRLLQRLADRGLPGLRMTGCHYVVLARRPVSDGFSREA